MNSRRTFLRQSLAVSAGFVGLSQFLTHPSLAAPLDPSKEWLQLPPGFKAKIISTWGDKMSDGFLVPGRADGMAAFQIAQNTIIVCNHENSPTPAEFGPYGNDLGLISKINRSKIYDNGYGKNPSLGGTTTLIFDEDLQVVRKQFLSLTGTNRNCAGGPTPWNSWITCEEDVTPAGAGSERFHGYNFEVPAANTKLLKPRPLKAMGRFEHEAVCVDPHSGIVYQTEDKHDGLIYRFIPRVPGKLPKGGVLQALVVKDQPGIDTRNWQESQIAIGQSLPVEWLTMRKVDSPDDDLRLRGHASGAAIFARGEGMWYGNREVFFACTNGGKNKTGQVFKYVPSPKEGTPEEKKDPGKLLLFAEPNDSKILQSCDNLTVAPWGDLVLVEDREDAHIRGITPQGRIYNIGRNIGSSSELAGICFSPSGKTMFVNIQEQGLTFAVTGPWDKIRPF